jgi:large subunit ribosomal protein L15
MRVDELAPAPGAVKRAKRVGRGIGGKGGKTAGRGTKGQKARRQIAIGFEGGQMPIKQRVPKSKGFNNPFRVAYQGINLDTLAAIAEANDLGEIDPGTLARYGVAHKGALIKVLGRGELGRPVRVTAHAFSASAEAAITAAGGSVEKLPLPFRQARPAASGNQFMNR